MNQTDKNILKKVDTQIQTLREVGMPTLKELRGFNSPVQLYPRYDGLGNTAQVSLTVK